MAGGVGSRLFPLSTPQKPKQFIDLLGIGKTLLQLTVERFSPVCQIEDMWVVTSRDYVHFVREQVPQIPSDHILAEPVARNTAPCIAYACRKISVKHPSANIIVTPADALVLDKDTFVKMIEKALKATEDSSSIVTVGITPTRPHTGYGYICSPGAVEHQVCKVDSFKEKPNLETAQRYLEEGGYFWNAGIFVWNARTIETQLRLHAPSIASVMDRLEPSLYTASEDTALEKFFPSCEKISIDYAVMEKSPDIYVIAGEIGWSDLGSFESIIAAQDVLGDKVSTSAREAVRKALEK